MTSAGRKDVGLTNAGFVDGHAASVPSRTAYYQTIEWFHGFPGTVNPVLTTSQQNLWNSLRWE